MKVMIKEPGQPAREADIPNTLEALQEAVGGFIETTYITEHLWAVFDEEGRLKNKKPNVFGLAGTIVFLGKRGSRFVDYPKRDWESINSYLNEKRGK